MTASTAITMKTAKMTNATTALMMENAATMTTATTTNATTASTMENAATMTTAATMKTATTANATTASTMENAATMKSNAATVSLNSTNNTEKTKKRTIIAASAPTRSKKSKVTTTKSATVESQAAILLKGCLEPLNHPNKTNWRDIVSILDSIFSGLDPNVKDEFAWQICVQLTIDVDYKKNILLLKPFFADIDHNNECINNNILHHTLTILSLINSAYDNK